MWLMLSWRLSLRGRCGEEIGCGELWSVDDGAVGPADDEVRAGARWVGVVAAAFALQVAEREERVVEVGAPERCRDFWGEGRVGTYVCSSCW